MNDSNTELLTINRENIWAKGSVELTVNEARILDLAHSKIKFGEPCPKTIKFSVREFSDAFGIDPKNAYDQMKEGIDRLYEKSVTLPDLISKGSITRLRLTDRCDYVKNEGYAQMRLSPEMQKTLTLSKETGNYTSYKLLHVKHLKTGNAFRLFQLLKQYRRTGWLEVTLEDFKFKMGVSDKYPKWYELERRVIKPSVKNINDVTDLKVTYQTQKQGRKIHRIRFDFEPDQQQKLEL